MAKKPTKKTGAKKPVAKLAKKTGAAKGKGKPLTKLEKAVKGNASEINELIERGRPRGFVTDNEILYYFPRSRTTSTCSTRSMTAWRRPASK